MDHKNIIPSCVKTLEEKFNVKIELTEPTSLRWDFYVSPQQPNTVLEEINNVLDDALDIYEDAISSFYTFDGHYFANVYNK